MKFQILPIFFIASIPLLWCAGQVKAEGTGITIDDAYQTITINPGISQTLKFSVHNRTGEELDLQLQRLELLRTDGKDVVNDNFSEALAAGWLVLPDPGRLKLTSGERLEVPFSITIPEDFNGYGSYRALIGLSSVPTDIASGGSGSNVLAIPSATVVINVVPSGQRVLNTIEASLSVPYIVTSQNVDISYEIRNKSMFITKPIAYLQAVSPAGEILFREVINPEMSVLHSGESINGTLGMSIASEEMKDWGKYTVELLAIDKQFENQVVETALFYVLPIWLLLTLGSFITLLAIILIVLLAKKVYSMTRR